MESLGTHQAASLSHSRVLPKEGPCLANNPLAGLKKYLRWVVGRPQVQDQTGVRFSGGRRDPHPPPVSLPDLLQPGENFSGFPQTSQTWWSEVTWACHNVLLSTENVITPQGLLVSLVWSRRAATSQWP